MSVLFKQGRQKVVLKSLFELLEEQSLLYTDAVSTGLTFLSTLVKVCLLNIICSVHICTATTSYGNLNS